MAKRKLAKRAKPRAKPRRRAKRVDTAARAIAEADALAALLADAPPLPGIALSPPAFIAGVRMRAAVTVWKAMVPLLAERNLIEAIDRPMFAMFCVYAAEFVAANEDVLRHGTVKAVKTVSGDMMLRENPAVSIRDHAAKTCMDLSRRFGLSPLDRAAVLRVRNGIDVDPGLFDPPPVAEVEPDAAAAALAAEAKAWGDLLDVSQAGAKPN